MAMTTPALYSSSAGVNSLQRSANNRGGFSIGLSTNSGSGSGGTGHRKSAVELLAETKAFYVKSETVRGRTQTLPLLSHSRTRNRNERPNLQNSGLLSSGMRDSSNIITSTLNRRSAGNASALSHQSNADMLQNALRKLLDCGSPINSSENIATNQSSTTASNDMSFDMECATPISPPAEYAFCASASERRYTTRSLSHSQPVSASSTRSGETPHPHENGCCSAHLVVLAKSLPDLHTTRNLNSSFEGSRSNKSATSDVFSLNRDSGGDSSGHLTHKSEPMPRRQTPSYSTMPPCTGSADKHWSTATVGNMDLRRDSGSSTQHSGSYYHNTYYDSKHNIYDSKNYPQTYSQDMSKNISSYDKNYSKSRYISDKSNSFETKTNTSPGVHYSQDSGPKSAGYYEKNSPSSFHEADLYNTRHTNTNNSNYFCRITKHGYPIPMTLSQRTDISNEQKILTQNVRNASSNAGGYSDPKRLCSSSKIKTSRTNSQDRPSSKSLSSPAPPVLFESRPNGEIILPPPIECCDNYSQENTSFMDTIIPPPVFEMENEIYESLEIKNVPEKSDYYSQQKNNECCLPPETKAPPLPMLPPNAEKYQYKEKAMIDYGTSCDKECTRINDNVSESSFHENVAPTVTQKGVYRHTSDSRSNNDPTSLGIPKANDDGPMSLPYEDPELSPGLGTFKRQKCFRFKQKANSSNNSSRPILRSKSDISDRYRRNSKSQPGFVRKSCGGEISRSVSHLEQFFEQLGLNSDAYDNLFVNSNGSDSDSPVYFSDVSTVDSNRPVSQVDSTDGTCPGGETTAGGALGPSSIFRSSEQPSIVERNARIIKWLCNCRKAQLAGTTQGYTVSHKIIRTVKSR